VKVAVENANLCGIIMRYVRFAECLQCFDAIT